MSIIWHDCEHLTNSVSVFQVSKHSCEQKSPKVQSEALIWLGEAIKAFGLKINVKPHIDYMKTMLAATNPVRKRTGSSRDIALYCLVCEFCYKGK